MARLSLHSAPALGKTVVVSATALILASCGESPQREYPDELVHLQQGWDAHDRATYYYTPQGTELYGLRYEWLRFLEMPLSRERLAEPHRLIDWGFLYDPEQLLPGYEPPAYNPGNFPVGFTSHRDSASGDAMLDLTCATCHTGQIEYGGRAIRIDGGPGMHAVASTQMGQLVPTLLLSLQFTYSDPMKFDRFARNVLGLRYPQGKPELRVKLAEVIDDFAIVGYQTLRGGFFPVKEGFGRIDALGHIGFTVFGTDLDPRNFRKGDAPVSYPHVWDIWKFDWVQWNGSVAQPMARNVGEALVLARLDLVDEAGRPLPPDSMYDSSVLVPELHCLETTLWQLRAPVWDERYLPEVDSAKVEQGEEVFGEMCAKCHGPHFYDDRESQATPDKPIEYRMAVVPASHVGTDPKVVDNFLDYRYDASALDPSNPALKSIGGGPALEIVTSAVIEREYREMNVTPTERWVLDGWGRDITTRDERGYKARPLHGIWGTAPFLHNGSVPTVYEMLLPEERRTPVFWTGTRKFDPEQLGIIKDDSIGGFRFDTSIPGNHNTGHQFRDDGGAGVIGRALTEEERWAVIEFLKVYGSRPQDWGTPPEGYGEAPSDGVPGFGPLFGPACATTLQGPSSFPHLFDTVAPTGPPAVRDTLMDRALQIGDSLLPPTRFGGEP